MRLNFRPPPFLLPTNIGEEEVLFYEINRIIGIDRILNRARKIVPLVPLFRYPALRLSQEFNPVAKVVEENLWNNISISTIDLSMIDESTYLEWFYSSQGLWVSMEIPTRLS